MTANAQTVAILGASNKQDRYSYKAFELLQEFGHAVIPVHPVLEQIDGVTVVPALDQIETAVDTLTVYVNATVSADLAKEIIALRPGRVIFNPGAESSDLVEVLESKGIPCKEACTLILLQTGQF